jgi:hypothetical protein
MTTAPEGPTPVQPGDDPAADPGAASGAPGAEIGITEGEGSTFEPEEDPEAHG